MQWEPPENLLSEHALPMLDAAWVASLLDFSAEYDLDVSEPPEGTDFSTIFSTGPTGAIASTLPVQGRFCCGILASPPGMSAGTL